MVTPPTVLQHAQHLKQPCKLTMWHIARDTNDHSILVPWCKSYGYPHYYSREALREAYYAEICGVFTYGI
jgi:hypothetical protein